MSFPLSDAANGLRNLFSQVVGSDVANNPHVLTRTFAKGLSLTLYVQGSDGSKVVPVPGVSVAVQVQAQNPDLSWTTVAQYSGGPSAANGSIVISDPSTVFDLTKVYQLLAQGSFPDGSSESPPPMPFWNGAAGSNWGRGFSMTWLSTYVTTGASRGSQEAVSILASPTSGNYPLVVQAAAYPAIPKSGLTYVWYSTSTGQAPLSTGQTANFGFSATNTIYCVMTDTAGKTYTSNSIVVTVNNPPPSA